ncbi:hypothetical protein ACO2Q0_03330 [Phenylobacterium sp. VNQ135]|uniref:hypothetical protein n=1 Tax=Phenylobacterium sp. VNQ135 TaxID=3400922 RepID=UPI003BFD0C08
MATLTEVVAAVVVHSSAVAFSHFGVTLDAPTFERPAPTAEQRVVARSPRKAQKVSDKAAVDCPDERKAVVVRA